MNMSLTALKGDDMEKLHYREYIEEVEDFPEKGVRFYDIAPLLGNNALFASAIQEMAAPYRNNVDKIVGFDARGFLFGMPLAAELGVGFAMLRKPGKLPGDVARIDYELEYGTNSLELQTNAVAPNERVVLVDDVIATGGTAQAGIELVRQRGAEVVGFTAMIDIPHLGGSAAIENAGVPVQALVRYEKEH